MVLAILETLSVPLTGTSALQHGSDAVRDSSRSILMGVLKRGGASCSSREGSMVLAILETLSVPLTGTSALQHGSDAVRDSSRSLLIAVLKRREHHAPQGRGGVCKTGIQSIWLLLGF
jgi:tRNA A37 threonylcarbamoyladenosine synthetase subunit TsaC/SUA5/YrdC